MKAKSSGSGMFLIEILLALLIFAIASAICLQVFVTAHQIAAESNTLNRAVVAAQKGAECFKATGGDLTETARLLIGEDLKLDGVEVFSINYGDYALEIRQLVNSGGVVEGEVIVSGNDGNLIFSIPVYALEVAP